LIFESFSRVQTPVDTVTVEIAYMCVIIKGFIAIFVQAYEQRGMEKEELRRRIRRIGR